MHQNATTGFGADLLLHPGALWCMVVHMSTAAAKFQVGAKVTHNVYGNGIVREVYAAAQHAGEETEYLVKLQSDRHPVTLSELNLSKR
jgi:hypothetical protein